VKWLIDTNVISETVRLRPNQAVTSWMADQPVEHVVISVVTLAEIQDGIRSADAERRCLLVDWFDTMVMPIFGERIVPLTVDVMIDWVALSRRLAATRRTRKAADLLIAATARVHGLTVVSRNHRDFADTGVRLLNPWSGETHEMETP
jgi:predicted nucleic acid-binding protein